MYKKPGGSVIGITSTPSCARSPNYPCKLAELNFSFKGTTIPVSLASV